MQNGQEPDRIGGIGVDLLNAYIDGELDQRQQQEVEAVPRGDPACALLGPSSGPVYSR
mgnify:CR=1 FL=1